MVALPFSFEVVGSQLPTSSGPAVRQRIVSRVLIERRNR
jgi:hypothetical protein